MVFRAPALIIVAHGSKGTGATPGGLLKVQLQQRLPHFDVGLGFLRVKPKVAPLLDRAQARSPEDILLFPLFFAQSMIVTKELPALIRQTAGRPVRLLPPAGCLPGFSRMLASRIRARLASNDCGIGKTAVFLISHGRKNEVLPASNLREMRHAVANMIGIDDVHNVQLEGPAPLQNWRDMTRQRKALFIPLMVGDGDHCLRDIPDAVNAGINEHIDILAPVGTWWELSHLLADYINRNWRNGGFEPRCSAAIDRWDLSSCPIAD